MGILELFNQGWDDLEQVANDAEVRHLEDGRFGIPVYRDDVINVHYTNNVLDCT
jgi:hypothetical protein